jgi:hypothetical protein
MRVTRIRRPRPPRHLRTRDDRGSLIIVLSIILVLITLSSYLFAKVVGNNEIIRARQNTFSGVTGANAGLSDALFRLDQGGSDVGTTSSFCLNPSYPSCTVTPAGSTPQLNGIAYVARTVPAGTSPSTATQWVVQAVGQAQTGFKGAVQETLTRSSKFPFAIFANKQLTITGNTTDNIDFGTYTAGPGGQFNACSTTSASPPCLYVGSNGPVSCSGPSPVSVVGIYYNNGSGGGSDSCGTAQGQSTAYKVPVQSPPPGNWTCPNNGVLGSTNGYGVIAPGTYVCTSPVSVAGTLTVGTCAPAGSCDPNVYLYVMTGSNYPNFITVAADSQINTSIPYSSLSHGSGPPAGATLPNSQLFQLYTDSSGNLTTNGNSDGFVYGGTIYAPNAFLTSNGCKSYFFGAVIINTYTCHGGPNLAFYYDSTLQSDYGSWQVSGYQQINPQNVHFP